LFSPGWSASLSRGQLPVDGRPNSFDRREKERGRVALSEENHALTDFGAHARREGWRTNGRAKGRQLDCHAAKCAPGTCSPAKRKKERERGGGVYAIRVRSCSLLHVYRITVETGKERTRRKGGERERQRQIGLVKQFWLADTLGASRRPL